MLLSDGNDRYSSSTAAAALEQARRSDVMVYPIALGTTASPFFEQLAALTGGRAFPSREPRLLNDTMRRVARELRYQYLIGYAPSGPPTGQWRSIEVMVRGPPRCARARQAGVCGAVMLPF